MGTDRLGSGLGRKVLNRIEIPQTDEAKHYFAHWLAARIPHFQTEGVHTVALWHGEQVAAVVGFCNPHYNRVEACWACDIPRAVTRGAILTMLGFAFIPPWNRHAISATAEKSNKRARRFMEGLGFRQEGVLKEVTPEGGNLLIYALLRSDFVTLIQRYRGQQAVDDFKRLCQ